MRNGIWVVGRVFSLRRFEAMKCPSPFTVNHGDGTNQQEDQHEGCSLEDDVSRRLI